MKRPDQDTPEIVSDYMAQIGARGGKAGKGRPKGGDPHVRSRAGRKAALARWRKWREKRDKAEALKTEQDHPGPYTVP